MSNSRPRPVSKIPTLPPSSPKRQPLHQRSESQENASAPTIRFVSDADSDDVYGKSPFPIHPSQILYPRYPGHSNRVSVSDENANYASTKSTKPEALVPSALQTRKSNRVSTSTAASDLDASFDTYGSALSPSSSRFSSRTSPPTSLFADEDRDRTSTRLTPVLGRITSKQSSQSSSRSTIRPVIPSASNVRVQDVVKQLETTLATSPHSDRPISSASSRRHSRPASSTSTSNYVVISNSTHATPAPKSEPLNNPGDSLHSLLFPSPKLRHKPKGLSSPPRTSQSPTRIPNSPERVSKTPTRISQSPNRAPNSPKRAPKTPTRTSQSPGRAPNSPERAPKTPTRTSQSPTRAPHSPKRAPTTPPRTSQSPTRAPNSPKRAPTTLSHTPASPTHVPESPPTTPKTIAKRPSLESVAFSDISYSANVGRPRSASGPASPAHAVRAAIVTGAKLQYSVVRAPSANCSWAEVSRQAPTSTPRMNDGPSRPQAWSSRLSTIASESTRTTQSGSSSGYGYKPRRRTIGSVVSDGASEGMSSFEYGSGVLTGTESNISIPIPQPLFSPGRTNRPLPPAPRDEALGRDSDEREDTVGELYAHPLRQQRSFLSRFSPSSRPGSAESSMSSRSQLSFMGDLSWARRYYSGEQTIPARSLMDAPTESGDSIRLNTATSTSGNSGSPTSDTLPNALWRPRTRPRNDRIPRASVTRDSAITEVTEAESSSDSAQRSRATLSVSEMMYSPHLRRDRRTTNRYSAWAAPSFEEPFVRSLFGPVGRQLLLFALGFIMPPLWMLAAIMPLPRRPQAYADPEVLSDDAGMSEIASQAYPNSVIPSEVSLDEKRWQKARWWRRVNRFMSIVGLLVIGAVA
ncbi:hypothetical protein FKW77_002512 [Venturia effusa]|uniref:Serine-rich protein n=1 Tax=Venturia effusa TaxID=50376 RepID=A0A517LME4_9PEZI|nr:hypothetical protein FKW77_002512 [Venturia effusa]